MKNIFVLVVGVFLLLACGEDGPPVSTTSLTQEQAQTIAEAIDIGLVGGVEVSKSKNGTLIRSQTETEGPEVENCEISGTKTTTSTTTVNDETRVNGSGSIAFAACTLQVNSNEQMVLEGTLNNSFSGTLMTGVASSTATLVGGLEVSGSNITSGVCGISVSVNLTAANNEITSFKVSGSICGRTVKN